MPTEQINKENNMENIILNTADYPTFKISNPKYNCPRHGDIENYIISSTIPDFEGTWCLKCQVESWDKQGINRVTEIQG